MIPSRLLGPQILMVPFATVLAISVVLVVSLARAQGQPPGRSPPPSSLRPIASGCSKSGTDRAEVVKLENVGKLDNAVALAVKALAVDPRGAGRVARGRGPLTQDPIAQLKEVREDWAAARKVLEDVLAVRQRQPDQNEWRIADAGRALADLNRRATLNPAYRQGWRRRID